MARESMRKGLATPSAIVFAFPKMVCHTCASANLCSQCGHNKRINQGRNQLRREFADVLATGLKFPKSYCVSLISQTKDIGQSFHLCICASEGQTLENNALETRGTLGAGIQQTSITIKAPITLIEMSLRKLFMGCAKKCLSSVLKGHPSCLLSCFCCFYWSEGPVKMSAAL